jgi:hypothetical protein
MLPGAPASVKRGHSAARFGGLTQDGRGPLYWFVRVLLLAGLLAFAVPAAPRQMGPSMGADYDAIYGPIVDVELSDIVFGVVDYDGRGVRTKGKLVLDSLTTYVLQEGNARVIITPVNEVAANFQAEAGSMAGREVELTGVVQRAQGASGPATSGSSSFQIMFWRYEGPPEPRKGPIKANSQTLESLVMSSGRHDGETVRVVGKFRGKNLYGDLPTRSERSRTDWVIKDDLFAAWVTGKRPKGPGWELDPGLKRDTGKWVEVVGRVETLNTVTYIRALEVRLTTAPKPTAEAKAPPALPERPKLPPVVVFSLPLDGDREIPTDSRFTVQFSKDMDAATFKGHVILRYEGPVLPGDRSFDGCKMTYDEGKRALTIDPGDILRAGRKVDLILLPGIADLDGLTLVSRTGTLQGEIADVFRFQIAL